MGQPGKATAIAIGDNFGHEVEEAHDAAELALVGEIAIGRVELVRKQEQLAGRVAVMAELPDRHLHVAVCIDENGKAVVYGTGTAYFLKGSSEKPEKCSTNNKLNWVNNKKAIQAYLITGKETGNGSFDLTNWTTVSGGTSKNMYITDSVLSIE